MDFTDRTIHDEIEALARLTGAPDLFVRQVRDLFERKGISLDDDVAPYASALEEAFVREEQIRAHAARARENLTRIRSEFARIGRGYARRAGAEFGSAECHEDPIEVPDAHRAYVTSPQSESWPVIPGPDEVQ